MSVGAHFDYFTELKSKKGRTDLAHEGGSGNMRG
jgi:hypothetical protein